jgi:hypothetical protein
VLIRSLHGRLDGARRPEHRVNGMSDTTPRTAYTPTGGWPRFAAERLLRLEDALERRRTAEQLLHGAELAQARALLSRAIFSLYLDCLDAGVGADARRLLGDLDASADMAPSEAPHEASPSLMLA